MVSESMKQRLKALSSAEDFFEFLELPFEPSVVSIARLHILRVMSRSVAAIDLERTEESELVSRMRSALAGAYELFLSRTPLEVRALAIHQKAAGRGSFVPLGALKVPGG